MAFNNTADNEGGTQPAWLTEDIEADQRAASTSTTSNDWATENVDVEGQRSTKIDEPAKNESLSSGATTSTNITTTSPVAVGNAQQHKRWSWKEMIKRDGRLLIITFAIIVLMNIPFIKYVLYPFSIFSTYVHEFCHGFSALLVGGRVQKLLIFPDTSGLAYTSLPPGNGRRAFVAASGYQGTAIVGCLLLIFRRTKRGPRTGTMTLAIVMLLSTAIWIRNVFGFIMIALLGIILVVCAWKLPSARIRDVYTCVAVTTTLNAITNVVDLFGSNQYVNGEPSQTDAHTVADTIGGPSWIWALLWLLFAVVMAGVGLVFAIPGPDESADFKCCGVCIDLGVFNICNKRRAGADDAIGVQSSN